MSNNLRTIFKNYKSFIEYVNSSEYFNETSEIVSDLQIQYKILFRNWNDIKTLREVDLQRKVRKPVINGDKIEWLETNFIFKDLLKWNYGYFSKINGGALDSALEVKGELGYYSDIIINNESIIDIFFLGEQPLLNVDYYEQQEQASEKLKHKNFHLIFDEVGTGKTVSALYCIRNIISEKRKMAKILIVCPNNKKIEWLKDIQRQLGLYAHLVENLDNRAIYSGNLKSLYFKEGEPCVFIEGQKVGDIKESLNSWTDQILWDLVVIDEGHLCFENYKGIKANKAVLLTATPIVVNSSTIDDRLNITKVRTLNMYISLLQGIVNDTEKIQINNLFNTKDIFTQIFREDLKIQAKKRNIRFIECERWQERNVYLDVLVKVKRGMTKLVYEQDDEFLIFGIFEKFKCEIEKEGYLVGDKPDLKNDKYDKLKSYLNKEENKEKSYILFFNYKYPANGIYEKIIGDSGFDKNNTIVAKKYGGKICEVYPNDNAVTIENIFDYLLLKIDSNYRVIFITTGASGGTGLNLGGFNGVINYEMPFTSIELEQRFGRVDRMDKCDSYDKEMVFMLNKDENPMLRYSTLKVNKTCEFMPIRNTVLFYPEFIDKNIESLKKELQKCEMTESDYELLFDMNSLREKARSVNKELVERIESYILKKYSLENFVEDVEDIDDYATALLNNLERLLSVDRKRKQLLNLEKEVLDWCNLLGRTDDEYQNDIDAVSAIVSEDEGDYEEYIEENGHIRSGNILIEQENIQREIAFITDDLSSNGKTFERLKNLLNNLNLGEHPQISTGLFYIKDGKYIRQTVQEYRNEERKEV